MRHTMVVGGNPAMKAPVAGILASDLAVGSIVKLIENSVATEYLVVNNGKPSGSSLYDDSCDGLWLLRKDIKENRQWHSSDVNDYKNSAIHAWLNGDFLSQFGTKEQVAIKQVKIPYINGTGSSGSVASGVNGLSTKIFLLAMYEVGFTTSDSKWISVDGSKLDYFVSGNGSNANANRIANLDGSAVCWWLRTPRNSDDIGSWPVGEDGSCYNGYYFYAHSSYGIRPALILKTNALFDETTLLLKGVA